MKYAVLSDLHANLPALTAVLERIDAIGVDQIVCLGDAVGYNAHPNECVEIIRAREIPTICGNHDAVACGIDEPWGFNPIALAAALWTRRNLTDDNIEWLRQLPESFKMEFFMGVHGAPPSDRNTYLFVWEDILPYVSYLEEEGCALCLFGHTHSPGIFSMDGVYTVDEDAKFALGDGKGFFINPGSVGQPRDGDPRAAFGLIDTETREYENVRVPYPVEEAAEGIVAAGLPGFLAERLSLGR